MPDQRPLPSPVSPPGTPTTGSALVQRANEMRARAEAFRDSWPSVSEGKALARDVVALSESVVGLSADVTRETELANSLLHRLVAAEAAVRAAEVRVKELEQTVSELAGALERIAEQSECGIGLSVASKHGKFCAFHIATTALARLAEALPSSSVVPVEAGTGTVSGQERAAPDGGMVWSGAADCRLGGLGREGMVTVWDVDGRYVGCMGVRSWERVFSLDAIGCEGKA